MLAIILEGVELARGVNEQQGVKEDIQKLSVLLGRGVRVKLCEKLHRPGGELAGALHRGPSATGILGGGADEVINAKGARMMIPAPAETTTKVTPAMTRIPPTRTDLRWRFNQSTAPSIAVNS
jgi:hypothetical protein